MSEWITVSEYARRSGLSKQGVYWRIAKNIIPPEDVKPIKIKDVLVIKWVK